MSFEGLFLGTWMSSVRAEPPKARRLMGMVTRDSAPSAFAIFWAAWSSQLWRWL